MRLRFQPAFGMSVAAAVGVAILLALGTWQLQRLQWKLALIDTLESRASAAAVDLPVVIGDPAALEFTRVRVVGRLVHEQSLYLTSRTYRGQVGQHVVTPLVRTDGGHAVLVDRGWVPPDWRAPAGGGPSEVTLEGIVRAFSVPGLFTPDNDSPGNVWYHMSRGEMAAATGFAALAPVYVAAAPGDDAEPPIGELPGVNLRNNHLGYALTWYGLAVALVAVFVIRSLRRGPT